jgi:hypothetical protein
MNMLIVLVLLGIGILLAAVLCVAGVVLAIALTRKAKSDESPVSES